MSEPPAQERPRSGSTRFAITTHASVADGKTSEQRTHDGNASCKEAPPGTHSQCSYERFQITRIDPRRKRVRLLS